MKKKMPYYRKKKVYGFLFITPWLLGFLSFFAVPFVQSCLYAFQELETTPQGMVGTWIGMDNFSYALFRDTDFLIQCANSLKDLITVPLILVYSVCFALLLKKEYPGRTTMRAIAFLPVIIGSGVLMDIMKQDVFSTGVKGAETVYLFSGGGLTGVFSAMGLPMNMIEFINNVISKIFDLTWRSGVQILLFLAGLHNIPSYVYEAAEIEGANALEQFFKITLPMLTPMILLNVVYSVIDIFSDFGNSIIQMIYNTAFNSVRFGYSSALSILYFLMIMAVLVILYLVMKRFIVHPED
ncbi:MAG: sugar ABC transporter permease [Lachnospiraceae bacterium]|nr:sugar ABC transporter permease [Lachnospiraceae bacterium]